MSWRPALPEDKLLTALATRDFGAKNAAAALEAWRHFDRAMDHYPVSGFVIAFCRDRLVLVLRSRCYWIRETTATVATSPICLGRTRLARRNAS